MLIIAIINFLRQISELRDLKKLVFQQAALNKDHEAKITAQASAIQSQQAEISYLKSQLNTQTSEISSQKSQLTGLSQELTRVSHTESGVADCGDSTNWKDGRYTAPWARDGYYDYTKSVRVTFAKPFLTPPIRTFGDASYGLYTPSGGGVRDRKQWSN